MTKNTLSAAVVLVVLATSAHAQATRKASLDRNQIVCPQRLTQPVESEIVVYHAVDVESAHDRRAHSRAVKRLRLVDGRNSLTGRAADLARNPDVRRIFLGG